MSFFKFKKHNNLQNFVHCISKVKNNENTFARKKLANILVKPQTSNNKKTNNI